MLKATFLPNFPRTLFGRAKAGAADRLALQRSAIEDKGLLELGGLLGRFLPQEKIFAKPACGAGSKERIFTHDKKIWQYDCENTWSAVLLPNGNFLIAAYGKNQVEEVTRDKKVVWSMPITAIRARLLESGTLLITDYNGKRAIEVERETKKILWEHPVPGHCWDIQRLENGNTLITEMKRKVELSPAKKVVWEHSDDRGGGSSRK